MWLKIEGGPDREQVEIQTICVLSGADHRDKYFKSRIWSSKLESMLIWRGRLIEHIKFVIILTIPMITLLKVVFNYE